MRYTEYLLPAGNFSLVLFQGYASTLVISCHNFISGLKAGPDEKGINNRSETKITDQECVSSLIIQV
jgi:hypothetical protein